jgi:LysR family transcriptional regulator of abg operon
VIGRAGHSLASATSLGDLVDVGWVVPSTKHAETSFAALFRKHHFKVPVRVTCAESMLSQLVFVLNSETLMIAPRQVLELSLYAKLLTKIPIREAIEAPTIVMVRRAALPLTPAADYFCDLMRRAGEQMQAPVHGQLNLVPVATS